jgi:hypothetical protein
VVGADVGAGDEVGACDAVGDATGVEVPPGVDEAPPLGALLGDDEGELEPEVFGVGDAAALTVAEGWLAAGIALDPPLPPPPPQPAASTHNPKSAPHFCIQAERNVPRVQSLGADGYTAWGLPA